MTELNNNGYLRFECGARYPRVGYLKEPFAPGTRRRKKDGRHRLVTFATPNCPDRPFMPDGERAPCLFGCPAKRASGRRMIRTWPDANYKPDASINERIGFLVTCHTEVVKD